MQQDVRVQPNVREEMNLLRQENEIVEEDDNKIAKNDDDSDNNAIANEMGTKYGARSGRYNLRTRKPLDFLHLFVNAKHRPHEKTKQEGESDQDTV